MSLPSPCSAIFLRGRSLIGSFIWGLSGRDILDKVAWDPVPLGTTAAETQMGLSRSYGASSAMSLPSPCSAIFFRRGSLVGSFIWGLSGRDILDKVAWDPGSWSRKLCILLIEASCQKQSLLQSSIVCLQYAQHLLAMQRNE